MQSTVPTQALTLLNSPVARAQAAAFAARLLKEVSPDDPGRVVARAWLLAFCRPITAEERERSVSFLRDREAAFARRAVASPREAALSDLCLALFNANEFVQID
jgi:Protein of unknown function (DUF1553)